MLLLLLACHITYKVAKYKSFDTTRFNDNLNETSLLVRIQADSSETFRFKEISTFCSLGLKINLKMLPLRSALIVIVATTWLILDQAQAQGPIANEEHIIPAYKIQGAEDICANRQVPISDIATVKRIIMDVRVNPEKCNPSYLQSFYELEPILALSSDDKLCGERKIKQIIDYHFRYINPKREVYRLGDNPQHLKKDAVKRPLHEGKFDYTVQLDDYKQEIMIPIALQQFFKAWALQVSGLCKMSFVENVLRAEQELLNEEDMNLLEMVDNDEVDKIVGKDTKPDMSRLTFEHLVYMPDLEGEQEQGDIEMRETTTILDYRDNEKADKFMHACKHRFSPIYSQLVLPLVRLSKLGYDYVGHGIDRIRDKLSKNVHLMRWLRTTSICEAQGKFDLVERKDDPIEMQTVHYEPKITYTIEGTLWIKGVEALSKELGYIRGENSKGFKKFLFNAGIQGRKVVAFLDPHQFAWYRRNQNTVSSVLNSGSIITNLISIGGSGRR